MARLGIIAGLGQGFEDVGDAFDRAREERRRALKDWGRMAEIQADLADMADRREAIAQAATNLGVLGNAMNPQPGPARMLAVPSGVLPPEEYGGGGGGDGAQGPAFEITPFNAGAFSVPPGVLPALPSPGFGASGWTTSDPRNLWPLRRPCGRGSAGCNSRGSFYKSSWHFPLGRHLTEVSSPSCAVPGSTRGGRESGGHPGVPPR